MAQDSDNVRVRMSPGPTGAYHIGRSRTGLLNWLFARHHGGTFILRIEDTDQNRSKPEHLQGILDSLRWLGLHWDEGPDVGGPYGPYFQMGRLDTYRESARQLLEQGDAYPCYCTPEQLDMLRHQAQTEQRPFRYPRTCRYLTDEERAAREHQGLASVLRLKVPEEGSTSFDDMVLGEVTVENGELDDFVIVRSNGIPLYNFAVVVDDWTMRITHVIRGQDHVPNTPRQVLIYRYLGHSPPKFAHVPLVVGMDRGKISARHGADPVVAYRDDGYLPEAIVNYLATVGVSYEDEREIFAPDELVRVFDLDKIGRSSPVFSEDKLEWMNGVHIRGLPLDEFVRRCLPFLQIHGLLGTPPSQGEMEYAARALRLEQERVKTLAEAPDAVEFFFQEDLMYDPALLVAKKSSPEEARRILQASIETIEALQSFTHDSLEPAFRALSDKLGLKTGLVFGTVRVAITGRTAAPPLFDTMEVLGQERVLARIGNALKFLGSWE